jgi:hypothetical protein
LWVDDDLLRRELVTIQLRSGEVYVHEGRSRDVRCDVHIVVVYREVRRANYTLASQRCSDIEHEWLYLVTVWVKWFLLGLVAILHLRWEYLELFIWVVVIVMKLLHPQRHVSEVGLFVILFWKWWNFDTGSYFRETAHVVHVDTVNVVESLIRGLNYLLFGCRS